MRVGRDDEPGTADEAVPGARDDQEPSAPGGGVPDFFGRGGLGAPESVVPGFFRRDEPEDAGPDLSGDGTATPVSGFHALLRVPAAPPAEWPARPCPHGPSGDSLAWRTGRPARRVVPSVSRGRASPGGTDLPARGVAHHAPPGPGARGKRGLWWHGQRRPGP